MYRQHSTLPLAFQKKARGLLLVSRRGDVMRRTLGKILNPLSGALVTILFLSGCGSYTHVGGTVTYKGKKLTAGSVVFMSPDGKKKGATNIASDGTYKLIEPPLGTVKVTVQVKPPPKVPESKDKPKVTIGDVPNENVEPVLIPAIYSDSSKSGLSTELKSGANTYDIELKEVAEPEGTKKGKK
jgi:hypothetical protein